MRVSSVIDAAAARGRGGGGFGGEVREGRGRGGGLGRGQCEQPPTSIHLLPPSDGGGVTTARWPKFLQHNFKVVANKYRLAEEFCWPYGDQTWPEKFFELFLTFSWTVWTGSKLLML